MHSDVASPLRHGIQNRATLTGIPTRMGFDPGACLSVRFPDLECGLCAPSCPVGAIALEAGQPRLALPCLGCGQCVTACPTSALHVEGFELPPRLSPATAPLALDCWRIPPAHSPPDALRVPCLGGIGTGWLLTLFERAGARPLHLLDRGACAGCAAAGNGSIETSLDEARRFLAAAGVEEARLPKRVARACEGELLPAIPESSAARPLERRGFFRDVLGSLTRSAEVVRALPRGTPTAEPATSAREKLLPSERLRVITALSQIAAEHERQIPPLALPQLSQAGCDAKGVCAAVCPTGALRQRRTDAEDTLELHFSAALCIACGHCTRACPERALHLTPEGGSLAGEVLARAHEQHCEECGGTFFGTAAGRCPECIKKLNLQQGMAALFRPFARRAN